MSFGIFFSKAQEKQEEKTQKSRKNIFFVFIFACFIVLSIPFMELISLFLKKKQRAFFWRQIAIFSIKILFFLGRLKIKKEGKSLKEEKLIYIANHLSYLDGFILLSVLGAKTTPITAPLGYFNFPFSYWFKRMEFIDVQRTEAEEKRYEESHSRFEAINEAIHELELKHSILIFPEGHISFQKRLLYFHSGATRIALASETKIVPVAIINIDNLNFGKYFFQSGTVKVVFGPLIDAVKYYKNNKSNVRKTSEMLKLKVSNLLPQKYLPLDLYEKEPEKTAAIFNINNTIYKGNVLFDLIVLFWKKGALKFKNLAFLSIFLGLYKLKIISESSFIHQGANLLKGWQTDKLYEKTHDLFHRYLSVNVSEKIKMIILDHKKKEHKIVFITNMIAPIAKVLADYLKVDYFLAENLEEKNSAYTGHLLHKSVKKDKGERINNLAEIVDFNLDQSFSYGHDRNDLSMLELTKYKTLVNPKSSFLEKLKNKKEFVIIKT